MGGWPRPLTLRGHEKKRRVPRPSYSLRRAGTTDDGSSAACAARGRNEISGHQRAAGNTSARKSRALASPQAAFANFQRLATRPQRLAPGLNHLAKMTSVLLGVTPFVPSSYNESVMLTVPDAVQEPQFASARVLAALLSVSAALSGKLALALASQPLR